MTCERAASGRAPNVHMYDRTLVHTLVYAGRESEANRAEIWCWPDVRFVMQKFASHFKP